MSKLTKVVTAICIGYVTSAVVHELGYQRGVRDVLKENNIDSFTYKTKRGHDIVYRKPE